LAGGGVARPGDPGPDIISSAVSICPFTADFWSWVD
jgi:hypothetical protein